MPQKQPATVCLAQPYATQARHEAIYMVLAQVPEGKVISYGELAKLANLGRAARWVGYVLAHLPEDSHLPWHRVIAADGHISLSAHSQNGIEQRARLRLEGILLDNDRVDIRRHGWRPMPHKG